MIDRLVSFRYTDDMNLTLSSAALGWLAQHFYEGKVLQNLGSVKLGKFVCSAENHFS
jgi:hypothetical protein